MNTPTGPTTEIFQAPATGTAPPASPPPPSGAAPVVPAMQLPPQTPIPPGPPTGGDDKKKFIFIGIGIVVVLIILFFIIRLLMSSSSGPKDEGNVELNYWGLYEDSHVMQVLIDDFEKDNPKIKVKYTLVTPEEYRDRVVTRIRNGNGPDIFRYHNSWVPMLTGVLLPLSSDAVSPKDFEKTYYPVIQTDLVQNGAILGIPLSIDTLALYTNDQMFASQGLTPPNNWDDFLKIAAALTVRTGEGNATQISTAGTALGTYENITHAPDIISLFMVQNAVDLYNITEGTLPDTVGGCTFRACNALTFYTLFAKNSETLQRVWDGSMERSSVSFANGRVGMYFGYSWDIYDIRALNPNLAFTVSPVPNLDSTNKKTIASYWVEGVSNKTKYPNAAMKFMKYLNEKETQEKYYTEKTKVLKMGRPYARVDLADSLKTEKNLYPFVLQAPYAVSTPFSGDTQDNGMNAILNGYLSNAITQISGNTSEETAVTALNNGVLSTLQQYGK